MARESRTSPVTEAVTMKAIAAQVYACFIAAPEMQPVQARPHDPRAEDASGSAQARSRRSSRRPQSAQYQPSAARSPARTKQTSQSGPRAHSPATLREARTLNRPRRERSCKPRKKRGEEESHLRSKDCRGQGSGLADGKSRYARCLSCRGRASNLPRTQRRLLRPTPGIFEKSRRMPHPDVKQALGFRLWALASSGAAQVEVS